MFYELPFTEAVLEQTNFLNIESIKPVNPDETVRRKSVMGIVRRKHDQ